MATRSRIGILNNDGTVLSIYCHRDGYVSHHGKILEAHWLDEAKVRELMKLGDISVLGEEIGEKHPFDAPWLGTKEYTEHEQKYGKWCKAYGRDRGETHTNAKVFRDVQNFLDNGEEYNYLFAEGYWMVQNYDRPLRPVMEALKETDED